MSTSGIYPSQAAFYGSEALMSMAGTLAETAEQELTDNPGSGHPLTRVIARALIANAYATLASVAAVRERAEIISEVMAIDTSGQ